MPGNTTRDVSGRAGARGRRLGVLSVIALVALACGADTPSDDPPEEPIDEAAETEEHAEDGVPSDDPADPPDPDEGESTESDDGEVGAPDSDDDPPPDSDRPDAPDPGDDPDPDTEPANGDAAGESTGESTEPQARRRSVIGWILSLGPSAPTGPSSFRAYERLVDRDCRGVLERLDGQHDQLNLDTDSERLYRAAATACVAALDDEPQLWDEAESLAQGATGSGNCLDVAVRELLDELLEARASDPDARFQAATGAGDARAAPCPRIEQLDPPAGPRDGALRVIGAHLDTVTEVRLYVGTAPLEFLEGRDVVVSSGELALTLDAPPRTPSICVVLHTPPDWDADGAVYTVEADADEGPLDEPPDAPCPPGP